MDVEAWNEHNPPGTPVTFRLVNGSEIETVTTGAAFHYGAFPMVPVKYLRVGPALLSDVRLRIPSCKAMESEG